MALEFHPNDSARQAHPSLWGFRGKYMVLLVFGVMAFIFSFRVLSMWGVDLLPNVIVSAFPLGLMTLFVTTLVNGQAPSHAFDLLFWGGFCLAERLYKAGALDRPPQFWKVAKRPRHPNEFNLEEGA